MQKTSWINIRGAVFLSLPLVFGGFSTAFAQAPNPPAEQKSPPPVRPEELECCKPFVEASQGLLECRVTLDEGQIAIELLLRKVELVERPGFNESPDPPGDVWSVTFVMCPCVSKKDSERIRRFEKEQRKSVVQKRDLRLIYHADIKTEDHCFRIVPESYLPKHAKDRKPIIKFINELAKRCKTIEGANASQSLLDLILHESLLDGK